ncbi:AsnC family transcriptional regulator [Paenibacillus sambharensis]|uniref:AsnC family transcriptional regulator n=1 Tax=Paenibacillus sambharensis TaxID=1803190 RepID=A0A2W1L0U4_9BACL|nr:Lrp/AsnC family transcriptional regulator [Paenibacillus sambharensis]PZD92976.1 AsnC family transcriptional regulator [Paenibacillus sambharensis]
MDRVDCKILELLQENARISMTELGQSVGLSTPAVKERVKKMEERNLIESYRAIVNPEQLDKHVTAFILFDTTACKPFREFCQAHPMVYECHRLAGQYSYMVKVVSESVQELETFIDASMAFGRPSTFISLSSPVKYKPVLPTLEASS